MQAENTANAETVSQGEGAGKVRRGIRGSGEFHMFRVMGPRAHL